MTPSVAIFALALFVAPARGQEATDTGSPTTDTGSPTTDTGGPEAPTDTGSPSEVPEEAPGAGKAVDTGSGSPEEAPAEAVDTGAASPADTGAPSTDTDVPSKDTGSPPAPAPTLPVDTGAPTEDTGAPADDADAPDSVPEAPVPAPQPAPVPVPRPVPAPPRPIGPLPAVPFAPRASDAGESPEGDEEPGIEKYREPFSVIADRAIGTTSVPVEFDWRRNKVQVGAWGSFLSELNNFNSLRAGALGRFPTKRVIWEVGVSYVAVGDTAATRDLALTPYRQAGRPRRAEIDFGVGFPFAEGVVTTQPRWFPAVQMVLNGYVDVRYRIYPTGYRQLTLGQVASSIVNPQLSPEERNNLEGARLEAMTIDRERFGLLMGVGNDFYFKPGLFLSPRVMFSVPLLAGVTETQLLWWSDAQLAVGAAF